jgi:DNA mismatch repair ATPase MutS
MASSSTSSCTTSVAILVGNTNQGNQNSIPIVVWVNQERTRESPTDPWKHTLEYYEFLDDTARWTHLDQLLLRYNPQSLHVGSSESLKSNTNTTNKNKNKRLERLIQGLQVFLDERQGGNNDDADADADAPDTACHLHPHVPVDVTKIESAISQVLLEDPDVQLAYRGNLQVTQGLLQQGLALWLQAEGLHQPHNLSEEWMHSLKMQQGILNSHLVMDRTAAQCIHLLPPANAGVATVVGGHHHNNSLYGVLSKPCLTQIGKHKLQVWLRQPLIDRSEILKRQDAITDLLGLGKDSIREALKTFGGVDLHQLANTLGNYADAEHAATESTKKPLQALYQLYLLASSKLPQVLEATSSIETSSSLLQDAQVQLAKLVGELERCQGLVETVLDLDQAPREYLVKPTFSSELKDLYQELQTVQQQVDDELEQMQQVWADTAGGKAGQVRLEQLADESSWQFRLPNTNDTKTLQTLGSKIHIHRVLKNGVHFSTLELRQLSAKYQELTTDYAQHSRQVVQDAMGVATTYQTVVERVAEVVSTLDCLCALAHVAAYSPHGFCKPTLTDSDEPGVGIQVRIVWSTTVWSNGCKG